MDYQNIDPQEAFRVYTGGGTVTVATTSADGVPDVMTAAWNCPFDSAEIIVVLAPTHTTTRNILDTGKFVVAIPENLQKEAILRVGSLHGSECGDKFAAAGVPFEISPLLGIKVLPGCLAYFECELEHRDIFERTGICLGKVLNLYARPGLWNAGSHDFAAGARLALHHITEDRFLTGGREA